MRKTQLSKIVVDRLAQHYPATCSLVASNDYELLFATRLSAQCTDARVNIVTEQMFKKYTSLQQIADAPIEDIMESVKTCGLFRVKARDIKACAQVLIRNYGGAVPNNMEDLLKLPGVGRKTANLVMGDIFGQPGIVADTHCIRIAGKLGMTAAKDPLHVEMDLKKIVEPQSQNDLCHRFVHFGRDICTARSPKCEFCFLNDVCKSYNS